MRHRSNSSLLKKKYFTISNLHKKSSNSYCPSLVVMDILSIMSFATSTTSDIFDSSIEIIKHFIKNILKRLLRTKNLYDVDCNADRTTLCSRTFSSMKRSYFLSIEKVEDSELSALFHHFLKSDEFLKSIFIQTLLVRSWNSHRIRDLKCVPKSFNPSLCFFV
jgi:hypothetical protein